MAIGGLRLWLSSCVLLLAAATGTPARALSLEVSGCENQDNKPGLRIDFCTQVIESGQYAGSKLAWAYVSRGWAYTENGDPDKGIKDFDEALRLKPNYGFALADRGMAYARKKDYERAIKDFDAALSASPKLDWALTGRGGSYDELGQYERRRAEAGCQQPLDLQQSLLGPDQLESAARGPEGLR